MNSGSLATRVVATIVTTIALLAILVALGNAGHGTGSVIAGVLITTGILGFWLRSREGSSKDVGVGVLAGGTVVIVVLIVEFVAFLFWLGPQLS
ncbi:hypothetical protein [Nocardioides conyzicola]|uniref:DUF4190 domain-containing protein n=1 Tax=Nocardioides conyzicola TaxID=1651781 RepID=A0ABP8X7I9_9ACTN